MSSRSDKSFSMIVLVSFITAVCLGIVLSMANREIAAEEAWRAKVVEALSGLEADVDGLEQTLESVEASASELATATATTATKLKELEDTVDELADKVSTRKAGTATVRADAKTAAPQAQTAVASTDGWRTSKASWYGPGLYGGKTANGTAFNPSTWCVAHRTLAMNTMLEIEYKGKVVRVPVLDRGPHIAGRELDLSGAVASALGFSGVHDVRWRIVGK